jgi:outer membrane protein assembly factor BamB
MNIFKTKTACMALFCCAALYAGDWPAFRGNLQRTGYYDGQVGFPSHTPLWTDSLRCAFVSSPSVCNNTLYIGGRDSCVYAINTDNGKILWKTQTKGWVDASPLIYKGMVIVGSRDNTIYVLDARTGNIISLLNAGLQLSSAAVLEDGTVLSGLGPPYSGFSGYIFSKAKWDRVDPAWSLPFGLIAYSSPALLGSRGVVGLSDGRLVGINLAKKDTGWSCPTFGGTYLSTPAIDDSTVYFAPGNADGNIYAVDFYDGKFFWKSNGTPVYTLSKKSSTELDKTASAPASISPWQFQQILRLSPQDRQPILESLEKQNIIVPSLIDTRKVRNALAKKSNTSTASFFSYEEIKTSSVAVGLEYVYVAQKELGYPSPKFTMMALDKFNGELKWRLSEMHNCMKIGYSSSPVLTRTMAFFGWGDGMLYGCDNASGAVFWRDTLKGDIISSPAIANARLYVATMDGYIYCYALGETQPGTDFQASTYCYPNPARGTISHIQMFVANAGLVDLTLFNSSEKPVFRFSSHFSANEKFTYDWNLAGVANGVYFALINVKYDDGTKDKKVLKVAVLK